MRLSIGVLLILCSLGAGLAPSKSRPRTAEWYGEKAAGPLLFVIGLVVILTVPRKTSRTKPRDDRHEWDEDEDERESRNTRRTKRREWDDDDEREPRSTRRAKLRDDRGERDRDEDERGDRDEPTLPKKRPTREARERRKSSEDD